MNNRLITSALGSTNNRVIVEAYKKEGLKSEIRGGIAIISQKNTLKGLKVLAEARLADGTVINAGHTVYIKEELLHNGASTWAKSFEVPELFEGKPFMVVEGSYIDLVKLWE